MSFLYDVDKDNVKKIDVAAVLEQNSPVNSEIISEVF